MEKLSLIDFLSLLLPGFLFVYAIRMMIQFVCPNGLVFQTENLSLENFGLMFCSSIFIGVCLHRITLWLSRTKLYKFLGVFQPVATYFFNNKILKDPHAKAFFKKDLKQCVGFEFEKKNPTKNTPLEKRLIDRYFDYMFYHLEIHHPHNRMYQFQSFYFFFRNCLTACTCGLPCSIFFLGYAVLTESRYTLHYLLLSLVLIAVFCGSAVLAKSFRKSMMNRLFRLYFFTHFNLHSHP